MLRGIHYVNSDIQNYTRSATSDLVGQLINTILVL